MSDSLDYTDDDGQTAHGDSDGVHEECMIPSLFVNNEPIR
jgi:hypothetical protein